MRFNCPYCGERGLEEFAYHGDATVSRPREFLDAPSRKFFDAPSRDSGAAPDDAWTDYVYLRDNPSGLHRELWYHAAGCHSWLVVTRDLRTHTISKVESARDVALARMKAL